MERKPSKTINRYVGAVKVFFRDHDIEVPKKEWRKLRKRGFIPKRVKAETQDKKPSKSELKRILNHLNIKGVHVKRCTAKVTNDKIVEYNVNVKIAFTVER